MRPDKHQHETLRYLGKGPIQYPDVQDGETPFGVAVREVCRTLRQDALSATPTEIMRDHVGGGGALFHQQPEDVRALFSRVAKVYGLTA